MQLAHVYKPSKHMPANWFCSIKLDGMRCFFDGGISRGDLAVNVPWANTDKDDRLLSQPVATGLWSRLGHVIHAPDWWIAKLPAIPLDGELWAGVGNFQYLTSVVKKLSPTPEWNDVQYKVFTSPPLDVVLGYGELTHPMYKKTFGDEGIEYIKARGWRATKRMNFSESYKHLSLTLPENDVVSLHNQEKVGIPGHKWVSTRLEQVLEEGHEGLMLQHPSALWAPQRSHMLLKVKPFNDDEGVVVGYNWGRETDKESKHLGRMGALILTYKGQTFKLSGFSDDERELVAGPGADPQEGYKNPGEKVSSAWRSYEFPIGSKVTFRYRELTVDGLPKEAKYHRKRASDD